MDEEKQIEEMAKDIYEIEVTTPMCEAWNCSGCRYEKYKQGYYCDLIKRAEQFYEKKYRKQSDTAREILKKIGNISDGDGFSYLKDYVWFARLCEEYGVKREEL